MQKNLLRRGLLPVLGLAMLSGILMSSSHREAPLIADDPLADNTDVYAFRSPDKPDKICIIANYIPGQLPFGGPNYYHFGENIRYEIHIDNNVNTPGDDITYRFTFKRTNEDSTTFFNIRLGKENLKNTYTMEKSTDGGATFSVVKSDGYVAPYNIGPRSITTSVGLGASSYQQLFNKAITTASTGEQVFVGPVDDPFFVDLGGIFDLGDAPRQTTQPADGLRCKNVSTIALEIPIEELQKDHKTADQATNILDKDFVIGVWASASRRSMRVLNGDGTETHSGKWVQVSRLGMPLTNEAVVPIGYKDYWNSLTPYQDLSTLSTFGNFFYNPELALYMDDAKFGGAIPAFSKLRIQKNSLGTFGFGNDQNGLYPLKGTSAVTGTALDDAVYGTLLLPAPGKPRSVDLWPIFNTGVPNLSPYQLATGKPAGNPLAPGKPFINNFLPNGGDMLRLNMAVPPTPRNNSFFSREGLLKAAVLGLLDPKYNQTTDIQWIPNMDGFPNGRRLEDDVTRIELQAVGGVVLAVLGLPYDDYTGKSLVTPQLLKVLRYNTGVYKNDTSFRMKFPYEQLPWSGINPSCSCNTNMKPEQEEVIPEAPLSDNISGKEIAAPQYFMWASPNPVTKASTIKYRLTAPSDVAIIIYDEKGIQVKAWANQKQGIGTYSLQWDATRMARGVYFVNAIINGQLQQTIRVAKQ
jgi:hypothetical protein